MVISGGPRSIGRSSSSLMTEEIFNFFMGNINRRFQRGVIWVCSKLHHEIIDWCRIKFHKSQIESSSLGCVSRLGGFKRLLKFFQDTVGWNCIIDKYIKDKRDGIVLIID